MIRINLLPVRQTRKMEAAKLEFGLAVFGGLFVLVLCGAGWGFCEYSLSATRDANRQMQADIDRLAADVKKVDEMEAFKAELERKLAVINDLRAKKSGPVRMIDEIALATPEKLFLTSLKEKSGELQITGVSVSNDVISQFLRAMDESAYFEQVFLQDIEAMPPEKNLSVTLKKFKLTARMVTPPAEPAAVETKPPVEGATPGGGA